jgi:hypothetical protein
MALAAVSEKDAELKRLAEEAKCKIQEERERLVQEMEETYRLREAELAHAAR